MLIGWIGICQWPKTTRNNPLNSFLRDLNRTRIHLPFNPLLLQTSKNSKSPTPNSLIPSKERWHLQRSQTLKHFTHKTQTLCQCQQRLSSKFILNIKYLLERKRISWFNDKYHKQIWERGVDQWDCLLVVGTE